MEPIKYGVDHLFTRIPLVTLDDADFLASATIAAGDAKIRKDTGLAANLSAEAVAFTSGSEEPTNGDTIDGATSGASGTFMFAVLTSGSWGGGDAAGTLFLKSVSGTFQSENLDINGGTANVMTIGGDTTAGLIAEEEDGTYAVAITAAESQCETGGITIKDQTNPKEFEDQTIRFWTLGHANAFLSAIPQAAAGTANGLVTSLSGQAGVNAVQFDGQTSPAQRLADMLDGATGYEDPRAPATQEQIRKLSMPLTAINAVAESYVLTSGSLGFGAYTDTHFLDANRHGHTVTGSMDLYYQFDIGSIGIPVAAKLVGYISGNNDDLEIYAYDWSAAAWDQVGELIGGTTEDETKSYDLLPTHVGTGANVGKVRIRFFKASGLISASLNVNQLLVSYVQDASKAGPTLLQSTTIATLASQTSFTLANGSADDDPYNGALAVITDATTGTQKAYGRVSDYTGSTKTVTLASDPGIFTMAVGDRVDIIAVPTQLDAIKAKTDTISSNVTYSGPVAADQSVTLVQGDDYLDANSDALTFTVTGYTGPVVTSTGKFSIMTAANYNSSSTSAALTVDAAITVSGGTLTAKVDLTDVQTAALAVTPPNEKFNYRYQLWGIHDTDKISTILRGALTVLKQVPEAS